MQGININVSILMGFFIRFLIQTLTFVLALWRCEVWSSTLKGYGLRAFKSAWLRKVFVPRTLDGQSYAVGSSLISLLVAVIQSRGTGHSRYLPFCGNEKFVQSFDVVS